MCGRFSQSQLAREHARYLIQQDHPPAPRPETWNLAPSTKALLLRAGEAALQLDWFTWGFSTRTALVMSPINARLETAEKKPLFAKSWQSRRCIVPADGWYEWRLEDNRKQPYYFQGNESKPLFLAGLWVTTTFCLLTQEAKGELSSIHGRRPVALNEEHAHRWCEQPVSPQQLADLSLSESQIKFHPVSRRVSSPRNDGSDLIEPIPQSSPTDSPFPNSL